MAGMRNGCCPSLNAAIISGNPKNASFPRRLACPCQVQSLHDVPLYPIAAQGEGLRRAARAHLREGEAKDVVHQDHRWPARANGVNLHVAKRVSWIEINLAFISRHPHGN